jgi:hypothetical protein
MRPDQRWFPTNRTERAAWFQNFTNNFAKVAAILGFSPAEVAAVQADNDMVQFLNTKVAAFKNYVTAVQLFQQHVTLGRNDGMTPDFPVTPSFTVPPLTPAGIFERLERTVRRVRVAHAYSDDIGVLLGIIPSKPARLIEDEVVPSLKAAGMPTNVIEIRFTRGRMTAVDVWTKVDKSAEWTHAGIFTNSPAVIKVPDNDGQPRAVQIRARYVLGNDPVGQYSNIVNVVTTP